MSEPFLAEIRLFAGSFAPRGWALCNGQLMSIQQNTALFSILGTTYGGNGQTNFCVPNFQGRAPMHQGAGPGLTPRTLGDADGATTVRLLDGQLAAHNHVARADDNGGFSVGSVADADWGSLDLGTNPAYGPTPDTAMSPVALLPTGGSEAHNNMQPYVGLNFIIALEGVFPPRS
jgi:microcystin-dependent protein